MFPRFMILAETDRTTSISAKPPGETTKVLDVSIPVLISRLSSLRTYACVALSTNRLARLSSHTTKRTKPVHNIKETPRMFRYAMFRKNSSQRTTIAITMINMVLTIRAGTIQGLPTQTGERELPEDSFDKFQDHFKTIAPSLYLSLTKMPPPFEAAGNTRIVLNLTRPDDSIGVTVA